ncbi:MAG: hypothetical protein AAF755_15135 [Pseudomonadota bacterium]
MHTNFGRHLSNSINSSATPEHENKPDAKPIHFTTYGRIFRSDHLRCWASLNVAAKAEIDAGRTPAALSFLRYVTPGRLAIPLPICLRCRSKDRSLPFPKLAALATLGGPLFALIAVGGYQFAPLTHGLLFASVAVLSLEHSLAHFYCESVLRRRGGSELWSCLAGTMWGGYTVLLRQRFQRETVMAVSA